MAAFGCRPAGEGRTERLWAIHWSPSLLVLLKSALMWVIGGPSCAAVLRRVSQTVMDLLVLLPAYL